MQELNTPNGKNELKYHQKFGKNILWKGRRFFLKITYIPLFQFMKILIHPLNFIRNGEGWEVYSI